MAVPIKGLLNFGNFQNAARFFLLRPEIRKKRKVPMENERLKSEDFCTRISFLKAGEIEPLISREWIATNGLGGYASGTVLGISTRRYHGLFIPNLPAPRGRMVMMPRFDEELKHEGRWIQLDGSENKDETISSEAASYVKEFRIEWQSPVWVFEIGDRVLEKRIFMPYGQNTVYVSYRLVQGEPIEMRLRPFVTFRGHDEPLMPASRIALSTKIFQGHHEVRFSHDLQPLKIGLRPQCGIFVAEEKEEEVIYRVEKNRGLDFQEKLQSPGYFQVALAADPIAFIASMESWDALQHDPACLFDAEKKRLEHLLHLAAKPLQHGVAAKLVLAADQFIILPGSRREESMLIEASGDHVRTIIAGYHWFTDWGRDTMISLEGLTLCTGRFEEAKAILRTFANYVHNGLLPNHFPEGQRTAIYNTVDATFWYFHAIDRYLHYTQDYETLKLLYPILKKIIDFHLKGTDFGIGVDPRDGLVRASAEKYQLTWMDAKVEDWVVTPRRGKPVEIQALWYNALCLMTVWSELLGESGKEFFDQQAKKAFESFNSRYWYAEGKYLFDVIDGEAGDDPSLRPNQVFAFSLRFPILKRDRWAAVLDIVDQKLLTPFGLRTLDPSHKDFRNRYEGDRWARDAAYHQGLVWTWLIGPFMDAWLRVHGDSELARQFIKPFEKHLHEAGIGTISEIFDAEPPYTPRGCIAQAWSVAEVLRAIYQMEHHPSQKQPTRGGEYEKVSSRFATTRHEN
jgi:predicted glycogen debranching enzyme